jgi:signal peptidase II
LTTVARRAAVPQLSEDAITPVRVGLLVAATFIVLDQATKELAEALLEPATFVSLIGDAVGWQLVYNPGGAFGLPAPPWLFIIVTVAVTVIVGRTLPHTRSLVQAAAYGLLLAGALGNAIDRVVRPSTTGRDGWFDGEVVDFVAWGTFPRFNVADSAITVGFALLVVALWLEERGSARAGSAPAEGVGGTGDPERSPERP